VLASAPMFRVRASRQRLVFVVGLLAGGLAAALLGGTLLGVRGVVWSRVLAAGTPEHAIVFQVRLPRALLGATVGAALAVAGVTFQTLVRNPLADPYVLGVSSGAAVGAAASIFLGIGRGLGLGVSALVGATAALALVYRLGVVEGRLVPNVTLLSGVVFNAFSWAIIVLLGSVSRGGSTTEMLLWLLGSLGAPEWPRLLGAMAATLAGTGWLAWLSPRMNALALGEEGAHSVGIDVSRTRKMLLLAASFLTAVAVAIAGPIGFVGIIVPHMLRRIVGPDHRLLVPASALGGGIFLSLCDTLTRLAFVPLGSEPPVSVLTALLGGPFFLFLLWRGRGLRAEL
jgi:iron complex transport system permease protein